jgi:hypothetical protein
LLILRIIKTENNIVWAKLTVYVTADGKRSPLGLKKLRKIFVPISLLNKPSPIVLTQSSKPIKRIGFW